MEVHGEPFPFATLPKGLPHGYKAAGTSDLGFDEAARRAAELESVASVNFWGGFAVGCVFVSVLIGLIAGVLS